MCCCIRLQAAELVVEIQRDGLQGLMRKAAAEHPGYTLGILAEGLVHHCDMRERRENGAFDTRPIYRLIDSLGVGCWTPVLFKFCGMLLRCVWGISQLPFGERCRSTTNKPARCLMRMCICTVVSADSWHVSSAHCSTRF